MPLIGADGNFAFEIRIKFPNANNQYLVPTQLSGTILTISNPVIKHSNFALWYEKNSLSSLTGNIFITSSAGKLQMQSLPIFDDDFYNFSIIKNKETGSLSLNIAKYESAELQYHTSSILYSGSIGFFEDVEYSTYDIGMSSAMGATTSPEFFAQEFRAWNSFISEDEFLSHCTNFHSYGKNITIENDKLKIHWRLDDGVESDSSGTFYVTDSTLNNVVGTGSNFPALSNNFTKFLLDYSVLQFPDGTDNEKIRIVNNDYVTTDLYKDTNTVSIEINMYDALNDDIMNIVSSYSELNKFIGLPVNKYREDYEGLIQMRETYFKRLQGKLNFKLFSNMLNDFDLNFVKMIQNLIPARSNFRGTELVIESHMLQRLKYQYNVRPVIEGIVDISGSIQIVDHGDY